MVQRRTDVTLTPPGVLRVDLDAAADRKRGGRRPRSRLSAESTSWWAIRATSSEVSAGFSKQALAPAGKEPGHDDALLGRTGQILAQLSGAE